MICAFGRKSNSEEETEMERQNQERERCTGTGLLPEGPKAGSGIGWSQEPGTPPESLMWMALYYRCTTEYGITCTFSIAGQATVPPPLIALCNTRF